MHDTVLPALTVSFTMSAGDTPAPTMATCWMDKFWMTSDCQKSIECILFPWNVSVHMHYYLPSTFLMDSKCLLNCILSRIARPGAKKKHSFQQSHSRMARRVSGYTWSTHYAAMMPTRPGETRQQMSELTIQVTTGYIPAPRTITSTLAASNPRRVDRVLDTRAGRISQDGQDRASLRVREVQIHISEIRFWFLGGVVPARFEWYAPSSEVGDLKLYRRTNHEVTLQC